MDAKKLAEVKQALDLIEKTADGALEAAFACGKHGGNVGGLLQSVLDSAGRARTVVRSLEAQQKAGLLKG